MRILLDTNIIIHREASTVINQEIGVLFNWLDNLHYKKCIHPITIQEINTYKDPKTLKTINIKIENYNIIKTEAPFNDEVKQVSEKMDKNQNDLNDTRILNELVQDRVDMLITEDRKIFVKAELLGVSLKVFTIDMFLEKAISENPEMVNYDVLSVKQEYFGNININNEFFNSFKNDYDGFESWFNKKSDEIAYVCQAEDQLLAFLYLKVEDEKESYNDINPMFSPKKRLKIGTFKVVHNGYKLGERFMKIIFDNAIKQKVDEIYVTIFDNTIEQKRLINLLKEFGFKKHGYKKGIELVYVRNFSKIANTDDPKITYPFIPFNNSIFLVSIYPEYHTELFPDSILRTESPKDYEENEPHRNAIRKVFISWSYEKDIKSGDVIIFYRTGGFYKGVVTTIGIAESIETEIKDEEHFIDLCKKRSVFTDNELKKYWNYKNYRPFIVNFLYTYSLPKRLNLKKLIEMDIIADSNSAPRGFVRISHKDFKDIIKEANVDESIIVY